MVVSHRNPLVLRGVSVFVDGSAVSLRLGSYETKAQTLKATPISMRHPSRDCLTAMPESSGRAFPIMGVNGNRGAFWAGRLSRAGVLGRRANGHRWSHAVGGPQLSAAVRLCLSQAKQAASVGDVFSRRSFDLHDFAFQRIQRDERGRQEPPTGVTGPATRTPTAASTRGNGAR
jgi:hypothetical protein